MSAQSPRSKGSRRQTDSQQDAIALLNCSLTKFPSRWNLSYLGKNFQTCNYLALKIYIKLKWKFIIRKTTKYKAKLRGDKRKLSIQVESK